MEESFFRHWDVIYQWTIARSLPDCPWWAWKCGAETWPDSFRELFRSAKKNTRKLTVCQEMFMLKLYNWNLWAWRPNMHRLSVLMVYLRYPVVASAHSILGMTVLPSSCYWEASNPPRFPNQTLHRLHLYMDKASAPVASLNAGCFAKLYIKQTERTGALASLTIGIRWISTIGI